MRHTGRFLLPFLAAGAIGAALLPAVAASADATGTLTQLTGFHQCLVDKSAGYVFLSEGTSSGDLVYGTLSTASGIVVTDLSGNYVTTLDSGDGVEGLALSPDGGTLYAALGSKGAVDVIATSSLTSSAEYSLPSASDIPYSLAVEAGKLWVSYNPKLGSPDGDIGDFDLSQASPTLENQPMGSWYSAPDLAADPSGNGTTLVAVEPDMSPAPAAAYDVSADPATRLGQASDLLDASGNDGCDMENSVTVMPGGTQFAVSCGSDRDANVYSTAGSLAYESSYAGGGGAVSTNASGGLTVVGNTVQGSPDVYVYKSGVSTPVNEFNFGSAEVLTPNGLAMSPDDSELFVVTRSMTGNDPYVLHVFDQPELTRSAISLTGPAQVIVGPSATATLTGSATLSNGTPLPADAALTVTRSGPGGTVTLPSPAIGSDGNFTVTDSGPLTATGTYTYTASYSDASGATAPSTATFAVPAGKYGSNLTMSGPSGTVTYGRKPALKGTLSLGGGSVAGRTITFTRTLSGSTASPTTFSTTTASDGSFTVTDPTVPAIGTYTYTAAFAGDASTNAASTKATVIVARTKPSLTITTSAANYRYNTKITVTANLGATFADRTVSIYATPTGQTKRLLTTAAVNSAGHLAATYTLARTTMFSVSFAGDVHNAPVTATKTVGAQVNIQMQNSGNYTTTAISGISYRVFHSTHLLYAHVTVAPSKANKCAVKLEVQQYDSSTKTWFANHTYGCYWLNSSSALSTSLSLTNAAGAQYRIRADYVQPSSDKTDVNTYGGWMYFKVVK
jgi:hypothetical protein